jgi:hypothetical protein
MFTSRTKVAILITASAIAVGAAATGGIQQEPSPAELAPGTQLDRPQYGPILATEPETIAEIKALYDAERDAMAGFDGELDALRAELATLEDADVRFEKQREAGAIRHAMQKTHIEIGLEIARLNEDERRVAEFEKALDFMLYPERYRPEPVHVDRDQ